MSGEISPFLSWCLLLALAMLFMAFALTVLRVLRGPTKGDRIVAIDLFGVLAVAFIGLFTLYQSRIVFLDAAIALALVAFFGTVAYARLMEKQAAEKLAPTREAENEHG